MFAEYLNRIFENFVKCKKKRQAQNGPAFFYTTKYFLIFYSIHDGLKGIGMVHCEVSQNLAVKLNIVFVQFPYKY